MNKLTLSVLVFLFFCFLIPSTADARKMPEKVAFLKDEVSKKIRIKKHEALNDALNNFKNHIGNQTLANLVELVDDLDAELSREVELEDGIKTLIQINRITG